MVDGETHDCVQIFCYLGTHVDADGGGGSDFAAIKLEVDGKRSDTYFQFLTSGSPPPEIKGRVHASCVKCSIFYDSEIMPLLADVGLKFERVEMQIIIMWWRFH